MKSITDQKFKEIKEVITTDFGLELRVVITPDIVRSRNLRAKILGGKMKNTKNNHNRYFVSGLCSSVKRKDTYYIFLLDYDDGILIEDVGHECYHLLERLTTSKKYYPHLNTKEKRAAFMGKILKEVGGCGWLITC